MVIIVNTTSNFVLYSLDYDSVPRFEKIYSNSRVNANLISERSPVAFIVARVSMESEMPDLSHLTPEERRVIENVLIRQRQEEEQERIIVE